MPLQIQTEVGGAPFTSGKTPLQQRQAHGNPLSIASSRVIKSIRTPLGVAALELVGNVALKVRADRLEFGDDGPGIRRTVVVGGRVAELPAAFALTSVNFGLCPFRRVHLVNRLICHAYPPMYVSGLKLRFPRGHSIM
ncbi:MAG: hypothetical protein NTV39_04500 [Candidatus Saccharibacteria bacterium]|nr:hypothetical protein [Candidatus Saccharibacteria bacterium]